MARHPGVGTTMWGQPYGSPVDSWVATPFVAAWGPSIEALRLPVFLLGLGLVPVAYGLARQLHPAAALPGGVPRRLPAAVLPAPRGAAAALLRDDAAAVRPRAPVRGVGRPEARGRARDRRRGARSS